MLSRREQDDGSYWRRGATDGCLFPAPIDSKALDSAKINEISKLFRLAGTFVAKSIVDNKLIDLPISSIMWDLLLGKVSNLFYLLTFIVFTET